MTSRNKSKYSAGAGCLPVHWTGNQVSHKTTASKSPGQWPESLCYQWRKGESLPMNATLEKMLWIFRLCIHDKDPSTAVDMNPASSDHPRWGNKRRRKQFLFPIFIHLCSLRGDFKNEDTIDLVFILITQSADIGLQCFLLWRSINTFFSKLSLMIAYISGKDPGIEGTRSTWFSFTFFIQFRVPIFFWEEKKK